MRTFFILLVLGVVSLCAKAEEKASATVHLYGFFNKPWWPFANAEVVSVEPGLIRFKKADKEFEHSGRFSIVQEVAPKQEKKWWQFSGAAPIEKAELLILYDFMRLEYMPFRKVEIYLKQPTFIVFECNGRRITHCGKYSLRK